MKLGMLILKTLFGIVLGAAICLTAGFLVFLISGETHLFVANINSFIAVGSYAGAVLVHTC